MKGRAHADDQFESGRAVGTHLNKKTTEPQFKGNNKGNSTQTSQRSTFFRFIISPALRE